MKDFEGTSKVQHKALLALAALMIVALFGLVGCGSSDESGSAASNGGNYDDLEAVTLILADSTSKGAAGNLWAEEVAARASEITDGKLTIDYHGCGDLGGDTDLIRQEQSNDIQMVIAQPAAMVSFVPDLAVFDLPLAFATYDADQIESTLNGDNDFTAALQESYEEAGLHNLGWLQNATYRQTTSNKALNSLEDFKGLQIRTMENANHMAFWEAAGAEPTPLAFSEVYFALQNGTVDAQENAVDTCVGASFQEVQDYLCMTSHILYANNISINKECWDSLDPAYQEALKQAIAEASETIRPQITELEASNLEVMTDAGVEVIEYDDSFFEEYLALDGIQAVYESISEQTDGLSDDMLETLQNA